MLRMIEEASIPFRYSVHDMYLACPTVYLINGAGEYCQATTDPAACRACLSKIRVRCGETGPFRDGARAMGVFSNARTGFSRRRNGRARRCKNTIPAFTSRSLRRGRSQATRRRSPCPASPPCPGTDAGTSVFLAPSARRRDRGSSRRWADRIRARRLPLRVVVVGYTDRDQRYRSSDNIMTVHGAYEPHEVEALLDRYRIALLLFPTIWPETFSYTLSEGWMAGRPALVPPAGALQERVLASGAGWFMTRLARHRHATLGNQPHGADGAGKRVDADARVAARTSRFRKGSIGRRTGRSALWRHRGTPGRAAEHGCREIPHLPVGMSRAGFHTCVGTDAWRARRFADAALAPGHASACAGRLGVADAIRLAASRCTWPSRASGCANAA